MRNDQNKELHETMIRIRANELKSSRYDVQADHISSYPKPNELNGHIPDILATNMFMTTIVTEVETDDSYDSEHTREQYKAFSNIRGTEFHVLVPKSCYEKAKAKAEEWGIRVDQWRYL